MSGIFRAFFDKPRGKSPTPPDSAPSDKDQVNLTDPESRIMPKGKGFEQAYNAQSGVDTESMLIVPQRLTHHSNDKAELEPMLERLDTLPQALGCVSHLLADAGYFSEKNVRACVAAGIEPYIAVERQDHNAS
ncbi:MAG: transposase, partial [Desulfovibrio sp.]|nr:transposase [Desulfovibrio sp.]